MKRLLMAAMAVAVAVTFSAPAFASEERKDEKKGGHVLYSDDKKEEKKGGHADTFGEEKKKDDHKGGH
jgi:Ni/Co efflux regulator RcnB